MSDEYTFNWHDLPDFHGDDSAGYEVFLKWATVHLLVDQSRLGTGNTDLHEQVRAASDDFTQVTLTIQVCGVEVNPEHLVRAIHANMVHWAKVSAAETLDALPTLVELRSTLDVIEAAARARIEHVAADLGLELTAKEDL